MPGRNQASFRNVLHRDRLLCINNFHCQSIYVYWLRNQWAREKKSMAAGMAPMGFLSGRRKAILNTNTSVQHHSAQYPRAPSCTGLKFPFQPPDQKPEPQTSLPCRQLCRPTRKHMGSLHLAGDSQWHSPGRALSLPASPKRTSSLMSYLQLYALTKQQRKSGETRLHKLLLGIASLITLTIQWERLTQVGSITVTNVFPRVAFVITCLIADGKHPLLQILLTNTGMYPHGQLCP